jgi:hypothetical protein
MKRGLKKCKQNSFHIVPFESEGGSALPDEEGTETFKISRKYNLVSTCGSALPDEEGTETLFLLRLTEN